MIRHEGRFPARLANMLRGFYQGADNLWTPVSIAGASAPMRGETNTFSAGPKSFTCDGGARRAASWGMGGAAAESAFYNSIGTPPYWLDGTFYLVGEFPWTQAMINETTSCGSGAYDNTSIVDPAVKYQILEPYGNSLGTPYFLGQDPIIDFPFSFAQSIPGKFALDGVGFGIDGALKRLKGLGATCVEAWAEVRFTGFQSVEWELTRGLDFDAFALGYAGPRQITRIENGVTVDNRIWDANGNLTTNQSAPRPQPNSAGPISLVLLGIEVDQQEVTDVNGNALTVANNNFVPIGSTGVADTDGEWSLKDVTALINALLEDTSRASSYVLLPSVGALPGNLGGLAALAESTRPEITSDLATYNATTQKWTHYWSETGTWIQFDAFSLGLVLARFRLPSGLLEEFRGPLVNQPPR